MSNGARPSQWSWGEQGGGASKSPLKQGNIYWLLRQEQVEGKERALLNIFCYLHMQLVLLFEEVIDDLILGR